MPVSQKDIALRIGVDRTLVAHALRGDPRVAAATRRRVEEVAAEMGYSSYSNMAARSLSARRFGKRPKTGMIAVLSSSHFEDVPVYEVPFFKSLMQGIEREAVAHELDIVLSTGYQRRLPRFIAEKSVDGVIFLHQWPDEIRCTQATTELPLLRLGDYALGEWYITVQDQEGMCSITKYLFDLGHRRIAYLGDVRDGCPDQSARDKFKGYVKALGLCGLPYDATLVDLDLKDPMTARGEMGMEKLLGRTRNFTALVCHNDSIAMGALTAAKRNGMRVPEDLSIVGYDDVSTHYASYPPITSVAYDRVAMGQRAVEMIYEQGDGPANEQARKSETVATWIREHQSCAAPRVGALK